MKSMKNVLVMSALLLFIIACSPKKDITEIEIPPGILPPDSMTYLITDMQVAEATLREFKRIGQDNPERNEAFFKQVFDKYNLNPERYKQSLKFYEDHPEAYYKIYTDVVTRLTQIQTEVNNSEE